MVNIAVFAAFHIRFDLRSVAGAEFKAVWASQQLDIWCYGRQRRQDPAKGWQGEVAALVRCGTGVIWMEQGCCQSPAAGMNAGDNPGWDRARQQKTDRAKSACYG
jgi:hypothetical protein